jgi:hypothetical protein
LTYIYSLYYTFFNQYKQTKAFEQNIDAYYQDKLAIFISRWDNLDVAQLEEIYNLHLSVKLPVLTEHMKDLAKSFLDDMVSPTCPKLKRIGSSEPRFVEPT